MGIVDAVEDIADFFKLLVNTAKKTSEAVKKAKKFANEHPIQTAVIVTAVPSTLITSYHILKGAGEELGKKGGEMAWECLKDTQQACRTETASQKQDRREQQKV